MRKALATLLLAAIPGFALSACNGPSNGATGLSALPNGVHSPLHPHDFSANDIHTGGATFPAYAYNLGSQPVGLASQPQAPPGTGSLFAKIKLPGATIYYCLTGSGTGRGIFEKGSQAQGSAPTATTTAACAPLGATPTGFGARVDPPDFAGSDVAMASTEYPTYKQYREPSSGTNWGEPFEMPVIAGPVVYSYRPQDFPHHKTPIQLSRWTYCAMANGTISDWNDPAITADNGGKSVTGGVSEPITFYFRSDGSGTGYNYSFHLNAACNGSFGKPYNAAPYQGPGRTAAWPYGVSQQWPGPGSSGVPNSHFIGESGNPGVLAAIQATPFSTGYLEGAWAKSANPAVAQAWLGTGQVFRKKPVFSDPTVPTNVTNSLASVTGSAISYGMGSDGIPLATSRPECILFLNPSNWNNRILAGQVKRGSYPIIAISYLLFYGNNNGVHTAAKKHILFYMTHGSSQKIINRLEYASLGKSVLGADYAAASGSNNGKGPCVQ